MKHSSDLRITFICQYFHPRTAPGSAEGFLDRFPIFLHLPSAMAARGHEVRFLQRATFSQEHRAQGVQYYFGARDGHDGRAGDLFDGGGSRQDIVHYHGIKEQRRLLALRDRWKSCHPRVFLHYHGGAPSRWPLRSWLERRILRHVDRFLMTTPLQARTWAGALGRELTDFEILPEGASTLQPLDRSAARATTGLEGDPLVLVVSRLDPIKDPLTVLHGLRPFLAARPRARVAWCFQSGEMLREVEALIARHGELQDRVRLLGFIPHEQMAPVFSSADLFVQASLREHSGFALLDALVTGLTPILSDIPSFRELASKDASYFEPGNAEGLARALLELDLSCLEEKRRSVRNRSRNELSYEALAERLERAYRRCLAESGIPSTGAADIG